MTLLELKSERVRRGLRQYQVAAALGVPQTTLCAWENGRRPLTADQERLIRDAHERLSRQPVCGNEVGGNDEAA